MLNSEQAERLQTCFHAFGWECAIYRLNVWGTRCIVQVYDPHTSSILHRINTEREGVALLFRLTQQEEQAG